MSRNVNIGVLAFHGDVSEHISALHTAANALHASLTVREVRTKEDCKELHGLIIPGGESTTLYKLCEREGMIIAMKKIPALMGTCAGAIMLAKKIQHSAQGQKTLSLMDIITDRNAYGRQSESFEEDLTTELGKVKGVFIRAPKIAAIGKRVHTLAKNGNEVVACEESLNGRYYLALAFHPELSTPVFHEHFLSRVIHAVG